MSGAWKTVQEPPEKLKIEADFRKLTLGQPTALCRQAQQRNIVLFRGSLAGRTAHPSGTQIEFPDFRVHYLGLLSSPRKRPPCTGRRLLRVRLTEFALCLSYWTVRMDGAVYCHKQLYSLVRSAG